MNKVIRGFGFAMMLAAMLAVGTATSYAQADCANTNLNAELDGKIRGNFEKWNDKAALKEAVDAGKQYIEKFGTCDTYKDFSDWLTPLVPKMETRIKFLEEDEWLKARFTRFDAALKVTPQPNWADAFAAGGEILQKYPVGQTDPIIPLNSIDQAVTLGMLGLDASYAKQTQYQDQALRYAQIALDYLKSGGKARRQDGKFGVIRYDLTREDAISSLTYTIGHVKYWDKKDRKGALANFYEVTQIPGTFKTQPRVYATIGEYYKDEAVKIGADIAKLVNDLKAATTDEEKLKIDGEIKPKEALFNGYAERAMDAFGRAHKMAASGTPDEKKYKDGLYGVLKGLYELRFPGKADLDSWVATTVAKPMPNPTTEVQPVFDAQPDATTTTTTTTGSTAVNRP